MNDRSKRPPLADASGNAVTKMRSYGAGVDGAGRRFESARNRNDTGTDMRSVLSLTTFAIGVLCFVAFVTKVRPVSIIAAHPPSEQVRVQ
jgi:hypothetical protein